MIVAALLLAAAPAAGPAAADRFVSDCAACHTIGGGDLDGPDLAPATSWPEADLRVAVERMAESYVSMTPEQVADMVALLRSHDVAARIAEAERRVLAASSAGLEPGSASEGRALFHGSAAFSNGGLPCSACHAFAGAGGTLAVALDVAAVKLGRSALLGAAESPSWAAMKAAYGTRPVTRQEAAHLAAYLSGEGSASEAPAPDRPPFAPALGLLAVSAALLALVLRGRNRGVRVALVQAAPRRSTR